MKRPDIEQFRKVLKKTGAHIAKTAAAFDVTRATVYLWMNEDPAFKQAVKDERGKLVDECLVSARVLALGIPEKDKDGNFVGWRERPDGNMLRYLLSTLGRREGFGEESDVLDGDVSTDVGLGVDIKAWLRREKEASDGKDDKDA